MKQVIITISEDDYIKRMPVDTFREQRRGGQGVAGISLKREDDAIKGLYVASTHDYSADLHQYWAAATGSKCGRSLKRPQIQRQTAHQPAGRPAA